MMPMLEECSKMPPSVSAPYRWPLASWIVVFATRMVPSPVSMISSSETTPSSRASAPVTILKVEPGS